MENANQIVPFDYGTHQLRTLSINGEPFFLALDICRALGLSDTNKALLKLDNDEKSKATRKTFGLGNGADVSLVNESGLYNLIFRSNKPEAKRFRKWVTSEVLPQLRQTGKYQITNSEQTRLINLIQEAETIAGSQTKLSQHIHVSSSTLSNYRNGHYDITTKTKAAIEIGCERIVKQGLGYQAEKVELLAELTEVIAMVEMPQKHRTTLFKSFNYIKNA